MMAGGSIEEDKEAERLERIWGGEFGDAYVERNSDAGRLRADFWSRVIKDLGPERVLEVGCNIGGNLQHIAQHVAPRNVFGVDVNELSLGKLRQSLPTVNPVWATAQELPFKDAWFDLTFTVGVLIHQPESSLGTVMEEIYRCSGRHILCAEYFDEKVVEIEYRGERGALFRRNYASIYLHQFPDLRVIHDERLHADQGFDDVTCTIFEKSS